MLQASIPPGGPTGPAMSMLFGTTLGRLSGGYKASLVARVHMRLGNWRKTVMPKEVRCTLHWQVSPGTCDHSSCHLQCASRPTTKSSGSIWR